MDPEAYELGQEILLADLVKIGDQIHVSGKTILMATHDYALILKFPYKTLKCEGGELFEVVQQKRPVE